MGLHALHVLITLEGHFEGRLAFLRRGSSCTYHCADQSESCDDRPLHAISAPSVPALASQSSLHFLALFSTLKSREASNSEEAVRNTVHGCKRRCATTCMRVLGKVFCLCLCIDGPINITCFSGTSPKLQVLCLHGYLQNSEVSNSACQPEVLKETIGATISPFKQVFRAKIGSLRKGLKSRVDFHFVDAPHSAIVADESEVTASGGTADRPLAWWTWQVICTAAMNFSLCQYAPTAQLCMDIIAYCGQETEPGMRPSLSSQYLGWEESAQLLTAKLKELPRIDGILGEATQPITVALGALLGSPALIAGVWLQGSLRGQRRVRSSWPI